MTQTIPAREITLYELETYFWSVTQVIIISHSHLHSQ
jgi:hypothetical protein